MSSAIVTSLRLDRSRDWTSNAEAARLDMERLGGEVRHVSGELSVMQREARAAGGGTDAQKARIQELSKALLELRQNLRSTTSDYKSLLGAGGASDAPGTGHGRGNQAQLAHSGRATLEMVMAGQSPLQALQVEAPRVIQAYGGALKTMLGIGAGIAVINKLVESIGEGIDKAKELKSNLQDALRPGPTAGIESISAMTERVKELDTVIEEAKPKLGMFERMGQWLSDRGEAAHRGFILTVTGQKSLNPMASDTAPVASEQNAGLRSEAMDRRAEVLAHIVALTKEENSLKEQGLTQGQSSVATAEIELRKKQEIAEIETRLGIPKLQQDISKLQQDPYALPAVKAGELARMQQELDEKLAQARKLQGEKDREIAVAVQLIERELAVRQLDLGLEEKILAIKKEGIDVEARIAAARADNATAKTALGPGSGLEHDQAAQAAAAKDFDQVLAGRATAQRKAEADLAEKTSGIFASPMQLAKFTVQEHINSLSEQLDAKNDKRYERDPIKRKTIGAEIAANQKALRDQEWAEYMASLDAEDSAADAQTTRGPDSHLDALGKHYKTMQDRADSLLGRTVHEGRPLGEDEKKELEGYHAGLTRVREQIEAIREQERARLQTLDHQTAAIEKQGYVLTLQDKQTGIRNRYQDQIDRANFEKNQPWAAKLERMRDAELHNAETDEMLMTPTQRAERTRENLKRDRAAKRAARKRGELSAQEYEDRHRAELSLDPATRAAQIARRPGNVSAQPNRSAGVGDGRGQFDDIGKQFAEKVGTFKTTETILGKIAAKLDFKAR